MSRAADDLELLTLLADLEDDVTPDYANRPLEDWEQDTDWEAITAALAGAYAAIEASIGSFHRVYVDELAVFLNGAASMGEAVARFFAWSIQLPRTVQRAALQAIQGISQVLGRLQDTSARITVQDAVKARIIRTHRPYLPTSVAPELWTPAATLPVLAVPARLQTIIGREIATPTALLAPDPQGIVDLARAMSLAGAVDKGRQAAHQAAGAGRLEAVRKMDADGAIGYSYASELLDERTCGPCGDVDGTRYDSIDAALVDYPGFGGYKNCDGGDRCRGTIVTVAASVSPPTLQVPGD